MTKRGSSWTHTRGPLTCAETRGSGAPRWGARRPPIDILVITIASSVAGEASQDAMQGFVRSCVGVLRSMVGEVGEGAWGEVQELRARLPARLGGRPDWRRARGTIPGTDHLLVQGGAQARWEGVWARQFEMQEVTEAQERRAYSGLR